ncbi:enoyl-CoA hydratase/isomerase family protein [Halogranum amylolyticum]|uniref:enoyl-CoA hydratase/isomerase family protein n=1 Tax=Halogranum amylolyticum TaxID=660520 RepID=UPI001B8D6A38|nr:enoyl-CoA hydratase/isomerase family protein [Halogranum amylolyticum]
MCYKTEGKVARIRLNRPDRLNAVTDELYEGIKNGLKRAESDDTRVVVLEGEGRAFCVGADLKNHDEEERTAKERREYVWNAQRACKAVQTHPMPIVAKVQGYAIGAGAELALSADFILMARDAEMRFPEVSIGTYIGGGVTYTLSERVGQARAKEIILAAESLTGAEAADEGVVTEAVPESELNEAVSELVDDVASNAPIPLRFAKEQFSRVTQGTRQDMLTAEAEALLACMGTDDWQEGIDAFTDDREPQFVGE